MLLNAIKKRGEDEKFSDLTNLHNILPGAPCELPADFRTYYDATVPARFEALVKKSLKGHIADAEEMLRELPARIDKARRLIED